MNLRNDLVGTDQGAPSLAADVRAAGSLRQAVRENSQAGLRETAREFEALLLNVMLKSMRETVGQDSVFDSEQTRLYTSLLDQQMAQAMSRRGIGIAAILERQLSPLAQGTAGINAAAATTGGLAATSQPLAPGAAGNPEGVAKHVRSFVDRLLPEAEAASRETGIPANFLMGHAALESGWGRAEIRAADGSTSHNLFGIKAGADWRGRTVQTLTTEYVGGVPQRQVETFRAYDSYADAFRDYANLLNTAPRYAGVLKNTHDARAYARELQQAGYATDPHYGDKLAGVIESRSLRVSMTA